MKLKIGIVSICSILLCNCYVYNNLENMDDNFQSLSNEEVQNILQQGINTDHLDNYFSEDDKKKGVVTVINDFIKPYINKIDINKFDKKVQFKTHQKIYNDLNEKFIDVTLGFQKKDTLMINFSMRCHFNAMFIKYVKKGGKWIKITKDFYRDDVGLQIINFNNDKENCLAKAILKKKYPKKYSYVRMCSEYDFNQDSKN